MRGLQCKLKHKRERQAERNRSNENEEGTILGFRLHVQTIAAAVAEAQWEVRSLGIIPNREEAIRKLVKRPGPDAGTPGQTSPGQRPPPFSVGFPKPFCRLSATPML